MSGILVIGSINTDISISVDKAPKIGETVRGKNYLVSPGGKGANQAIAAAHFGKDVSMIALAGNDSHGDLCVNNLKANGINTDGVGRCDTNTGVAVITVVGGDNFIILDEGANKLVTVDYIKSKKDIIEKCDYVVFQFEIPLPVVFETIKYVKSLGKKVVLNPAPIYDIPEEIYKLIDIFILNEHEAGQVLGCDVDVNNAEAAVSQIVKKGIDKVVITLGGEGSVYNDGDIIKKKPARKVKAVDTTAAGDTFIGAFCTSLCNGKDVNEAVEFATCASAITVSRMGAADSIPSYDEVAEYMQNN